MQNFSWIEPYRQIAEKLVDWEDRQKELIAFVEKLREKGFKVPNFNDRGVLLNEIDPFTFLMVFNRVIRDEERIKILDEMKSFFKLDFQTPSDFTGIGDIVADVMSDEHPYHQHFMTGYRDGQMYVDVLRSLKFQGDMSPNGIPPIVPGLHDFTQFLKKNYLGKTLSADGSSLS